MDGAAGEKEPALAGGVNASEDFYEGGFAGPIVAKQVRVRVDYGDLTALLYIQGYRGTEFIHSV